MTQCAVSDKNETVTMTIPKNPDGIENFYLATVIPDPVDSDFSSFDVKARTLDSIVSKENRKISFIKCDIEGHELHCLLGASGVIKKSRPAWFIEIKENPDIRESAGCRVFEIFRQEGYEPYIYSDSNLRKRQSGEQSVNYFFLQQSHVDKILDKGNLKFAG